MDLTESFDLNLVRVTQLDRAIDDKQRDYDARKEVLSATKDAHLTEVYRQALNDLQRTITELEAQRDQARGKGVDGLRETPLVLRQEVANQIRLKLSFLGVSASASEKQALESDDPKKMVGAIADMSARASSGGQYGVRQVVYKGGYTSKEADFVSKYRLIRKDVEVSSLRPLTVYARGTSLSVKNDAEYAFDKYVGGARLYLGFNAGSEGRCGNTRACNVTIDYTFLGATLAQTSRSSAIVIPVTFEADISMIQPDFSGEIECHFQTGWQAKGRADVKDGAIIYDGDVYNQIQYHAIEEGACQYNIARGSANSAAYHMIKQLYLEYMTLKHERGVRARKDKDDYQEYVNRELQEHANRAQSQKDYDFSSLTTWTSAFGLGWGTVASFVVGSARNFYWHTRIEDQKTTDAVNFKTTINESNVELSERVSFDGSSIVCWRGTRLDKYIGACPEQEKESYSQSADHDAGKNQALCGPNGASASCLDRAREAERRETTDANGVTDPWE